MSDNFWVKLPYMELAVRTIGMNKEEKSDFLDKMIRDFTKNQSDDDFLAKIIEERSNYRETKKLNGKKGAEKRWRDHSETIANHSGTIAKDSETIASNRNSNRNSNKEIKPKHPLTPSCEVVECEKLVEFWNSQSWTKKITAITSIQKEFNSRRKIFGKNLADMIIEKIPSHEGRKDDHWFTLRNILESENKTKKFLDNAWLPFGEKKPNTLSNEAMIGFYQNN